MVVKKPFIKENLVNFDVPYYDYNKLNEKHDTITGKEGFE